jgi:hypothetical protein
MVFFFLDISPSKTNGLCNQLYYISSMCSYALKNNIKYIFLNKFLMEINSDNYCPISEIIDIKKTNQFLQKYDIVLFDSFNFDFEILSINFGSVNNNIDITRECIDKFKNNNSFIIKKDTNICKLLNLINNIFSEEENLLLLKFKINDTFFNYNVITNDGILINDITINFNNFDFQQTLNPYIYNDNSFEIKDIIQNIIFNEKIINKVDNFFTNNIKILNKIDKINVLHLRMENDVIESMIKINNFDKNLYKTKIENKYIKFIRDYIDKKEITIVLSYDYNNEVIKFLDTNNYNFIMTPKYNTNRDISAIIDMHIGQYCNNIFIGTFESSFSYMLFLRMYKKSTVIPVILSLQNIDNENLFLYGNT